MGFSDDTRVEALTRSGRHCCICHRFVGLKIELHHITLRSEGGDDTLENCIPLCFDCHSEMSSYDKKHPKGSKYTTKELRTHRDNWFQKFSDPIFQRAAGYNIEIDAELYRRLRSILPSKVIEFFRGHHFGQTFYANTADSIYEYADKRTTPDDEFIDPELESLRANLHRSAMEFANLLSHNTWTDVNDRRICSVPSEWKSNQYVRYADITTKLNSAADKLSEAYDALVGVAIRKLGVRLTS